MEPEHPTLFPSALATLLLLALLSAPHSAAACPARLRAVDARAATLIAEGLAKSPAVRTLVDRIGRTNLLVYVEYSQLPAALIGRVALIGTSGRWRYLRIQIDCRQNRVFQLMALGHELQHAAEIGEADAFNDGGVQQLYAAIGFRTGAHQFETAAAERTGMRVRHELLERLPRPDGRWVSGETEAWDAGRPGR